ncbi:hypothetical protein ACWD4G_04455 [Streptomyces sp. NPDC002643]
MTTYGSLVAVASLVVAAFAAATTAHANPDSSRVKVQGSASCERFEDAVVDSVTITPRGKPARTDQLSGEDEFEEYSLTFTKIPKGTKGLSANARVSCVDADGDTLTYGKSFKIKRPADPTTEVQVLNLK